MIKLEDLTPNAALRGILPDTLVTVVSVQWYGSDALELTYKTPSGKVANQLLYRHNEPELEIAEQGRPWSFDGDGALFRLVSEALRIRLAHLFDPVLAVHTSVVDPLPHQITAVYEAMLPRQPLRFLLADDPGAGKTIMAGLLIKELIARGDLQRCLIVCPGSLAEQWQDELYRRYQLGQLLSTLTRHFLLMSATPHNGKEEDFQLFMALLDGDRFEGRFRDGVHTADVSDLMRRMVKENLLKFDGTPLFPERIAYTVPYKLSDLEAQLYKAVTDYVRQEFNRAEAMANDKRAGTVGFALTILQRRLASSPEAIYRSLHRRREKLESRLRELELLQRGGQMDSIQAPGLPAFDSEDVDDLEDAPDNELEETEAAVLDQATAARSLAELKAELATLNNLEGLAQSVLRSGTDAKWRELASLHDPAVKVLLATDAAGEGINLQRAHLMVNYDLPWNPNRLEQRFGRIHRIGQTEVCHLWNLVADETREGDVYRKLLEKLEQARKALGGQVFDVLGKLQFEGKALRDLLIEAVRYGDQPDVRARLTTALDNALDRAHLAGLLEDRALAHDSMDASRVYHIREEMERAEAKRLQPHYIEDFFLEAFKCLA